MLRVLESLVVAVLTVLSGSGAAASRPANGWLSTLRQFEGQWKEVNTPSYGTGILSIQANRDRTLNVQLPDLHIWNAPVGRPFHTFDYADKVDDTVITLTGDAITVVRGSLLYELRRNGKQIRLTMPQKGTLDYDYIGQAHTVAPGGRTDTISYTSRYDDWLSDFQWVL